MSMIEIWSLPDCPRCDELKAHLMTAGVAFNEKSLVSLRAGEIRDEEALVELAINDGTAPLIRVHGHFITLLALPTILKEARDGRT